MLIFRYLARDFLASAFAVSTVLLMIVMSGRFVKYLAEAAAGEIDAGILFSLIGARLPGFLELIIPLACFLGILLAYGRLYIQNEMTVMIACGMSENKLAAYTLAPALVVAALVAYLSLYATPNGARAAEVLILDQNARGNLDGMASGHFYPLQKGKGVTYAEKINEDGVMLDVFLAEHHPDYLCVQLRCLLRRCINFCQTGYTMAYEWSLLHRCCVHANSDCHQEYPLLGAELAF